MNTRPLLLILALFASTLSVRAEEPDSIHWFDTLLDDQLAVFEPNYLIFDGNHDIKFYLSSHLKLLHFSQFSYWAPDMGAVINIKAFWGFATEESQPFDEINWNPEIHLRWTIPNDEWYVPHWIAVARAHESDGAAADSSRGWDRWKFYSTWRVPLDDFSYFEAQGSVWLVAAYERHYAPNMPTYLGFMNWLFTLRMKDFFGMLEFRVTDNRHALAYDSVQNAGGHVPHPNVYPGQERWYVHVPIIPSFRAGMGLKVPWEWEDFYIYAEYFSGYAEELYAFNQKTSTLRLGIAAVRDF